MATTFYVKETAQALVDLLDGIALTPLIYRVGDMMFDVDAKGGIDSLLPAIFVKPTTVELDNPTLDGGLVEYNMVLRVLLANDWDAGDDVWDAKFTAAKQITDAVVDSSSFDLDNSVSGPELIQAYPDGMTIDLAPPEEDAINALQSRRIHAVAVNVPVSVRATR